MTNERIIEIATNNRYLAVERGFMIVSENKKEIARVPLDDIAAVIGNAHGLSYSNNLLVQLAKRKALLIICGQNFSPVAFLWAIDGHHQQSTRMEVQIKASTPKSKQIWKQIVRAKITEQANVLRVLGKNNIPLTSLIDQVRSGDPTNIEAQAARRYWPLLFGKQFRRNQDEGEINFMLNYGYTIIRSTMARCIMAAGLHPSIGVHHCNMYNPMRLVDDMMEPFRPAVDLAVYQLVQNGHGSVSSEVKVTLVSLLETEVTTEKGNTALRTAIQNLAISLAQIFENNRDTLNLPISSIIKKNDVG